MEVGALQIHPRNLEIYGEPDEDLAESIGDHGIQHPISIDRAGSKTLVRCRPRRA